MVETAFDREDVISQLKTNEYSKICFYKVNGEIREMTCTLNQDQLNLLISSDNEVAEIFNTETANDFHYDQNQIRIFDTEKKDWRSFLLTNLISIEGINI